MITDNPDTHALVEKLAKDIFLRHARTLGDQGWQEAYLDAIRDECRAHTGVAHRLFPACVNDILAEALPPGCSEPMDFTRWIKAAEAVSKAAEEHVLDIICQFEANRFAQDLQAHTLSSSFEDYMCVVTASASQLQFTKLAKHFEYLLRLHRTARFDSAISLPQAWKMLSSRLREEPFISRFVHVHTLLPKGTMLGDYQVQHPIGVGGQAVVYKAMDSLQTLFAIKVAREPKASYRFAREARKTVPRSKSHLLITTSGADLNHSPPYFVMPFVQEGKTLEHVAHAPARSPEKIRRRVAYLRQAAEATAALHRAGWLHCDIKPGNLLVEDRKAKLSDLGLCERLIKGKAQQLNDRGQPCFAGTLGYCSPEQENGGILTPASDVYSLGATLQRLITGPATSLAPVSIPQDLSHILRKAQHPEAAHRYQTAQELGEELDRFLQGKPVRAKPLFTLRQSIHTAVRSVACWIILAISSAVSWNTYQHYLDHRTVADTLASAHRYRTVSEIQPPEHTDLTLTEVPPEPTYDHVSLTESSVLFDLTDWQPVPENEKKTKRKELAYFTRVVRLHLRPDAPKVVAFRFRTSGKDVVLNCPNHPCRLIGPAGRVSDGGFDDVMVRDLYVDLSAQPVNREILIVIQGNIWNGFQTKDGTQWAALQAPCDLRGELAVAFPPGQAPDQAQQRKSKTMPAGSPPVVSDLTLDKNLEVDPAKSWLKWTIHDAKARHVYCMNFQFPPAPPPLLTAQQ